MRNEEWREVEGWPYEVSDQGRVRRSEPGVSTFAGKVLSATSEHHQGGYSTVTLSRGDRRSTRTFCVHQLVARAFLGPLPPGYHVNHKNSDKKDDRLCNLEYVTAKENIHHAIANGQGRAKSAKLNPRKVRAIRSARWGPDVARQFASEFGVNVSAVYRARNGDTWGHVS